jgi:Fic family protein
MSKVLKRRWRASFEGFSRRDRTGCDYEAYVPDPVTGREFRLDGEVAADVADAEAAIARLNVSAVALVDAEALARLLLRAESVASSFIEGLAIGGRRLLRAEVARKLGDARVDVTAAEVLGNIDAMTWAVEHLARAPAITVDGLVEVHRRLLADSEIAEHAGRIRTVQNWIGGRGFNPCDAAFVPPPPEYVEELLRDLSVFASDDALPAVMQAAIAHAQFETIHPFVDGNGRAGRALIHVILRRRGVAPRVLPPVSLALAAQPKAYIGGLSATRYRGRPDSTAAHAGVNSWVGVFAAACRAAVDEASVFEERIGAIQREWRAALGRVRAGSAVSLLLEALPGAPILTVGAASSTIERSYQATNEAMTRLEEARVVRQITVGRRNRAFEAKAVIDAFVGLEERFGIAGARFS